MKKILGLDLGVASIGWAFLLEDEKNAENNQILDLGVRVIPLDTKTEKDEFAKGGNVGTNVKRRMYRGARRNLQRYRLRRTLLKNALTDLGLLPTDTELYYSAEQLYQLRDTALSSPVSLPELGRIFMMFNNRRGFKSTRKGEDKSESDYKEQIRLREENIRNAHQTPGQYFAKGLRTQQGFRVKQELFNRATYQAEFDEIWTKQAEFYPDLLTEKNKKRIRDRIIYYQRPLRSQKGLVGECALEWYYALEKETKAIKTDALGNRKVVRPKCAPKSSPLAQECRIWENIHNIRITNERGDEYPLSITEKKLLFDTLQNKKEITAAALLKLLKLTSGKYTLDALIREKGLEGNRTRVKLLEVFQKTGIQRRDILEFAPKIEEANAVDFETGNVFTRKQLVTHFDQEPLYQLWHLLYATEEEKDLIALLQERYQFTEEQARALAQIDFTSAGFSNKSSRAMRRLLPHLQNGDDYTEACKKAGYNHSNSLTKEENAARLLAKSLLILPKNSLRNPVVEKILNQMIHLVNTILDDPRLGKPDEIRVELARELKQSAKERKKTFGNNNQRERERKDIRKKIAEMLKIDEQRVTKVQIEKWQLWHEVDGISLYTGKKTELASFLRGDGVDIEHIIPKSRCFDDSFENKTICETRFNQEKDKFTARDFMEAQPIAGLQSYEAYLRAINELERADKSRGVNGRGISKAKYNRLMMRAEDIPQDFLNRQLRETQYITKKARQILQDICHNVYSTSGTITDFLRNRWGWDEVIEQTRLEQFRMHGKTKTVMIRNGTQEKEVIEGWTKRLDHRHHALDALTVACTKQSIIQQLNTLNQTLENLKGEDRRDALRAHGQKNIASAQNAPFATAHVREAIENVLISFKQGANVASPSKNVIKKVVKQHTLTPRGPLHEETVYGQIKFYRTVNLDSRFKPEWLDLMVHPHQKELVMQRLTVHDNNIAKAFKGLAKDPILYGKGLEKSLKKVTIWDFTYVSRKDVAVLTDKQVEKIVDKSVQKSIQERIAGHKDIKEALKQVGIQPIFAGGPFAVKKVRVKNPAPQLIALPRGYVESSGNHHIAIYKDQDGKKHEVVVNFWEAFKRVKAGLPIIIKDVKGLSHAIEEGKINNLPDGFEPLDYNWEFVTSLQRNEMFVFNMTLEDVNNAIKTSNYSQLSKNLFRVMKISSKEYWFSHHLETENLVDQESKNLGRSKWCSISSLESAIKVKVNRLGKIVNIIT